MRGKCIQNFVTEYPQGSEINSYEKRMMNMPKKYKVVAVSGSLQAPSRTLVLVEHIVSALGEVLPIETEVITLEELAPHLGGALYRNQLPAVAQQRLSELKQRRTKLNTELEFYQNDPKKAPANLRRQLDDNTESQAEQQRFIKQQEEEKQRINQRFDAELQQLRKLWADLQPAATRSH